MQYIDIRSDTVTHPTQKMRFQCINAQIGDHSYGEDPSIIKLEQLAAQIMGKQAASFVPSGCFGNQCTILAASVPLGQIILPDRSHVIDYQQGSAAGLSRVLTRTIPTDENMFMPIQLVQKSIRKVRDKQAPRTFMLQIQNPTGVGAVYPLQHFNKIIQIGKSENLHIHMDGARVFNACQFLNIEPKELVKNCTTVMFCLSKGLCCPIGSMVVGPTQFINKFNIYKKMLGGYLRKPGMFASMGIIALKQMTKHLKQDHRIAKVLTQQLQKIQWLKIVREPQINMVFFEFIDNRIQEVEKSFQQYLLQKKNIKCVIDSTPKVPNRFVVHHFIRQKQIQAIVSGFKEYHKQFIEQQTE